MESEHLIDKYKNGILNLAIVVVAVIIAVRIYGYHEQKITEIKTQKDLEERKNTILGEISTQELKLKAYRDFINNKDISATINVLGDLAKETSIKIISMRPDAESADEKYLVRYPFSLEVEASSFHELGNFISVVESHPSIFTVDVVSIRPREATETEPFRLNASLRVSTVMLMD